jgi:AraC-like DNA-binding protein
MLQRQIASGFAIPAPADAALQIPADWGVSDSRMRSGHLRGILQFIRVRGGDPMAALARSEIEISVINDPDELLPCSAVVAILEDCSHSLGDPLFGMRFGATQSADVFGSVAALGRAASTVSEGLRCFVDYLPLIHSSEGHLHVRRAERHGELRWVAEGQFATNRQGNYQSAVLQMMILRMLAGKAFKPNYVTLMADVPAGCREELESQLGCRVEGTSAHNAIGFDARVFDWPVLTSNRMIHALIESHFRSIGARSRPNLVEQVQAFIDKALPVGRCTLRGCAAALGMSARTLQVRLERANKCFTEMVEQRRAAIARELIGARNLTMVEIAGLLGYAEQSSFSRAFRRWYGASPQQLRTEFLQRSTLATAVLMA